MNLCGNLDKVTKRARIVTMIKNAPFGALIWDNIENHAQLHPPTNIFEIPICHHYPHSSGFWATLFLDGTSATQDDHHPGRKAGRYFVQTDYPDPSMGGRS